MSPTPDEPCPPALSLTSRRHWLRITWAVFAGAGIAMPSAAGQWPFGRGNKSPNYLTFKDPAGRFSIEYPNKDWQVIPGTGSVIVAFAQKNSDASVLVDYTKLKIALAPNEIDTGFGDLEVQLLKERQPTAANLKPRLLPSPSAPRVVIEFDRTSSQKQERVIQHSIPTGADLYRIVCAARVD